MTPLQDEPIIVLGMHRSGTSLLAGSLQAAGLELGMVNNLAPHNKAGNKENLPIRALNDKLLAAVGADWKRPPSQLPVKWTENDKAEAVKCTESLRRSRRLWGFKDPRTVWTLEGWLEIFPNARMIAVFRHPHAVARSLCARGGNLALSMDDALALWKKTNIRLLELVSQYNFAVLQFSGSTLGRSFMGPLTGFCESLGLRGDPTAFFRAELNNNERNEAIEDPEIEAIYASLVAFGND